MDELTLKYRQALIDAIACVEGEHLGMASELCKEYEPLIGENLIEEVYKSLAEV